MAAPIRFSNVVFLLFLFVISHGDTIASCKTPKCVHVTLNATQTEPFQIAVKVSRDGRKLCILCYPGQSRMWHKLWINPKVTIEKPDLGTTLEFYYGYNVTEVVEKSQSSSILRWSPFMMLKEEHAFDPFNASCIGIASEESYKVNFIVKNPEKWFVAYTALGLLLFFLAVPLSRNIFLQYGTGVSVGILGSLLIAVFIISRFLPQKLRNLGYVIAAVSTSASMFLYHHISSYFSDVITNHWQILLGYIVIMGLVSFAVVYRYGPISNKRTLNLVQWTLQLLGMIMVYQGTQIAEVSVAIIVVALMVYIFPPGMFVWVKKIRYRFFRPKTHMLTEEEFYAEGEVETKKALAELRDYCRSPNCDAWRTISRLSSPNKFASFIEGSYHLSDAELEDHNTLYSSVVNDDSDSECDFSSTER